MGVRVHKPRDDEMTSVPDLLGFWVPATQFFEGPDLSYGSGINVE
jgi:hypothetical protein